MINQRYLKSSTILTSNVGVADWAGAFSDATVAFAMPDRLLHRAAVAGISGPFYWPRGHQNQAPTPCARESTHMSPDPTHNDERLIPRPANRPVRRGEYMPGPRDLLLSPLQERRPPTRSRQPGRTHRPSLRGHVRRQPPTPSDLLLARMPSRVGKTTQPHPGRRTSTPPGRTPPSPPRPAAGSPRPHRPTGTDSRPKLPLRPARHDRRPAHHPGSRPPHDHQPRHRHRPAQTPPVSFG
ncbi:ATP-binding protein [Streptomyces sp. PKU-MA01144]|uniref:ATP-binding protein n=1 Tax=Streptomyces sp. PKU-MA01144 TaxID=2729138 RepID=UPI0034D98594